MKPRPRHFTPISWFLALRLLLALSLGAAWVRAAPPGRVVAWGAGEPGSVAGLNLGQSTPPASTQQGVLAISAIGHTSAAILANGSVVTWGYNAQNLYLPPSAAGSGIVALGTGPAGSHFLALKADGSVVAWGANDYGQITGTPSSSAASAYPVTLGGQVLSGVVSLASGNYHSVVAKSDGTVVVWGDNTQGQLNVPAGLSNVVAVAAGSAHSLALTSGGTVVAWGQSINGQTNVPSGLTGVVAITAGAGQSFALKSDGTVVGWGYDTGPGGQNEVPATLTDVVAITAGFLHCVAQKSDGSIVAWGSTSYGQISVPTTGLTCPLSIVAGSHHTVALVTVPPVFGLYLADQTLLAGQTAVFNCPASGSPPLVYQWFRNGTPLTNSSRITGATTAQLTITGLLVADTGDYHVEVSNCAGTVAATTAGNAPAHLAVLASVGPGKVVAWGDDTFAQLAVPAAALSGVVAVSAGQGHTLALKQNGSVLAWGWNTSGQSNVPAAASSGVVAISAGQGHSLALKSNGTVLAWGNNSEGQINIPAALVPSWFSSSTQIVGIAAGGAHSVALPSSGVPIAWGSNGFGQCTIPSGLSTVTAVAAGFYHTVALRANGTVAAWGDNTHGQSTVPPGLTDVVAIAAGFYHTVAVKADGTVVAWGAGGTTTVAPQLGQSVVPPGLGVARAPAAGRYHSLALLADRTVVGWGDGSVGQITMPGNHQGQFLAITAGWMHNAGIVSTAPINVDLPVSAYVNLGHLLVLTGIADGTPPLSYRWQRQSAMGYGNVSGATGPTLTLSDVQAAQSGNYRLMASNALGSVASAPVMITTLAATTFAQWRGTQFNSAQLADPGISGPHAMPAGDGVPNLLKYAFNVPVFGPNPMAPAPVGPSGLGINPTLNADGALRLDFHAVRADLTYTVEASTDLRNWSADGVIMQTNGTARTATYMPPSSRTGFLHILISQ